ncbi:phospholipase A2 [Xylariomycetidae sp. FL0641]|nr:phospholipase A2 [Xylariomycetidae sp. FL0641]
MEGSGQQPDLDAMDRMAELAEMEGNNTATAADGDAAADPIVELLTTYNELNACRIEELDAEPSPLEFLRRVARNTPFVVRGGARDWPAVRKWSADYLRDALRGHRVNVAVTPHGNADAPTPLAGDGTTTTTTTTTTTDAPGSRGEEAAELVFAKPHEEDQDFGAFLDFVIAQGKNGGGGDDDEVRYAQTQNDNLRHEYAALFGECQRDIAFARVALGGAPPDAVNLWIGNARSVTALHRDNYENIYVQVLGRKHFVLLPPLCQPCVGERALRPARYVRREGEAGGLVLRTDSHDEDEDEDEGVNDESRSREKVPFATWDPDDPTANATPYSHLAQPMRVTLEPGDMLYLPALWYHKVSQSCIEDEICVAANYWYDMDFSGPLYPLVSFVRNVALSKR